MNQDLQARRRTNEILRIAGTCRHHNQRVGLLDDDEKATLRCGAGVLYVEFVPGMREDEPGWARFMPCRLFGLGIDEPNPHAGKCPSASFPSREEAEAKYEEQEREIAAALAHWKARLAAGLCVECASPAKLVQRGPCVYATPCGHRQYQGTLGGAK